ncbi:MAG TPA: peptide MFS transporter [Burkholderiaceae bacterium]
MTDFAPPLPSPAARPWSATDDTAFLGHPRGLGWLAFSELWERFSYYGMQTLLVLYMVHALLLPGHVEHVWGFDGFRRGLESVYGPLSVQALASAIFGLYAGTVYLTPIAGGWIADRWLGRTTTITVGALLMALGHFLMAFEASFLIALACLLLGVGAFKGNISSQVGALYGQDDPRRATAFQIFLLAVQIAVIVSPWLCGHLTEDGKYWDRGFGAAGVGMVIGLLTYLGGRRWMPPEERIAASAAAAVEPRPPLSAADRRKVGLLVLLIPVLALTVVGNQQIFNSYLIWAEKNLDLHLFGQEIAVTSLISLDSIISTATLLASLLFWHVWRKVLREPDELMKITMGVAVAACAPLLLAGASAAVQATGHRAGIGWVVASQIVNDFGFANILPVGLALYSRAAPRGMTGTMVGVYYTHLFFANMGVGWLGGQYEKMSASAFWTMHAAIVGVSAVLLLLVRLTVGRGLTPAYDAPAEARA